MPDTRYIRQLGWIIALSLLVLSYNQITLNNLAAFILASLSCFVIFISYFFPLAMSPIAKLWLWLGGKLHAITSPFILGSIYFFLITPIALILKLIGRDLLLLKPVSSTWKELPKKEYTYGYFKELH